VIEDLEVPKPEFEMRTDFKDRFFKLRDRIKYLCLEVPINCDCLSCRRIDDQFEKFFIESKKGMYELEGKKMDEQINEIDEVVDGLINKSEEELKLESQEDELAAPIPTRKKGRQPGERPCAKCHKIKCVCEI
jgi:hypothetical protein